MSPVGCQYSVTTVDLRRLEPADVLMSHPHPLLLTVPASPKGTREDYRGYMNGPHEDHTRLRPDEAGVTDRVRRWSRCRAAVPEQP
jgi:hypothetical protein